MNIASEKISCKIQFNLPFIQATLALASRGVKFPSINTIEHPACPVNMKQENNTLRGGCDVTSYPR